MIFTHYALCIIVKIYRYFVRIFKCKISQKEEQNIIYNMPCIHALQIMQLKVCTSQYVLKSIHFTVCTSQYALHSMHFTLCISQYAFHCIHFTEYISQ